MKLVSSKLMVLFAYKVIIWLIVMTKHQNAQEQISMMDSFISPITLLSQCLLKAMSFKQEMNLVKILKIGQSVVIIAEQNTTKTSIK
jgi:hypothetical protein